MVSRGNFAFIDSQNLNLGVRSLGWKLDYKKFRLYLRNKYDIRKAYLFIGQLSGNEKLYISLEQAGYLLIFKPTIESRGVIKGNVDAELVLHCAAIQYDNYEKAIIVSGDGDFYCLVEYLANNNKLLYVFTPNRHYSSLLKRFDTYLWRVDNARSSLEYRSK